MNGKIMGESVHTTTAQMAHISIARHATSLKSLYPNHLNQEALDRMRSG